MQFANEPIDVSWQPVFRLRATNCSFLNTCAVDSRVSTHHMPNSSLASPVTRVPAAVTASCSCHCRSVPCHSPSSRAHWHTGVLHSAPADTNGIPLPAHRKSCVRSACPGEKSWNLSCNRSSILSSLFVPLLITASFSRIADLSVKPEDGLWSQNRGMLKASSKKGA